MYHWESSRAAAATPAGFGVPPDVQDLTHLKPRDAIGLKYLSACAMLTAVGLTLSVSGGWFAWTCGQILLGCAFLQWFVLLHEAGHRTLFRSTVLNHGVGHIASFFALIPFECWKLVHARHHVWTGWQDLDATTAALVPRALHPAERRLVNLCWKFWIPLFSVLYRATNFWNLARLQAYFPHPTQRRCLARGVGLQGAAYLVTLYIFGIAELVNATGLALLLCLMLQDLLLLSQHTHIPQNLSRGRKVGAFPLAAQEAYTRSLRFPAWFSAWILHFDAHELHHMYPRVPGYRLRHIGYAPRNEVDWWLWVCGAKRLSGEVFLFQSRTQTGFML